VSPTDDGHLTCRELVELVSDYLGGHLEPEERARFEMHLAFCDGCIRYVEQLEQTRLAVGALREDMLDPRCRDDLLAVFRDWKRSGR
jgi:anti-sigma factor RsiW